MHTAQWRMPCGMRKGGKHEYNWCDFRTSDLCMWKF